MDFELAKGALPSPVDTRDWTLAAAGAPTKYPESCFLDTDWMIPSNQAKIGCCVGCTGEEVVRLILKLTGNTATEELSFRFVYAVAKCLDGVPGEGTYPSLVAKIIRTYGVPLAKYCPNDVTLDHEAFVYGRNLANIPKEAIDDAKTRKSGADFNEPVSMDGIQKALNYAKANNGGVMILRRIGDTYWKDKDGNATWDKDKLLPIRVPSTIVSGHEEFLTGYDYEDGRMRIYWLNHWSGAWCDRGRAWEYADEWLPYIVEMRVVVPFVPVADDFKYTFKKYMRLGEKGPDIVALQHCLKIEGMFPETQAFTGKYGPITQEGVKQFQQKYLNANNGGIQAGPATIAKLNERYSKGV